MRHKGITYINKHIGSAPSSNQGQLKIGNVALNFQRMNSQLKVRPRENPQNVGPNELCIVPWRQIHQFLKIELKFLHFPSLRQKNSTNFLLQCN
jgi:hypothetical protein